MSKQQVEAPVYVSRFEGGSQASSGHGTGSSAQARGTQSLGASLWHDVSGTGAEVGTLAAAPTDLMEALKEEASGNLVGMVDESKCLALIKAMAPDVSRRIVSDAQLTANLLAAFNDDELRAAAAVGSREVAEWAFEQRFGIELKGRVENSAGNQVSENENATVPAGGAQVLWQQQDILDVWDVLATLPESHVEENTAIKAFEAISGNRGFWSPSTGEVQLGQRLNDQSAARIDHTVRHEIGHAVHDSMRSTIDAWLNNDIGFRVLGYQRAGCEALVEALGGFPSGVNKTHVLNLLDAYLASTSWSTKNPIPPGDAEWAKMPNTVHTAVNASSSNWYQNYKSHPSGVGGRVFFNHYYENTMVFSAVAEAAIDATGDNYSAMSPAEFFANCYAEYFGNPAGFVDSSQWGGRLPGPVKAFFRNQVLHRQPYAAPEQPGQVAPTETTSNTSGLKR